MAMGKKSESIIWENKRFVSFKEVLSILMYRNLLKSKQMLAHQVLELFCCIAITNASKSLTAMQQRYASIEQEVLAVVPGCQRFHQYIYGKKVVIQSDHKPLEVIMKKPLHNTSPRLQRMLLSLQKYIDLVWYLFLAEKENILADTLSHTPGRDDRWHNRRRIDSPSTYGVWKCFDNKI